MPELPEVETIARGLAKRVVDDVISSVWLGSHPEPFKTPPREMAGVLEGRGITSVRRVGKHIVFDLGPQAAGRRVRKRARKPGAALLPDASERAQWIVHLGMTGRMIVAAAASELDRHTHAILRLASGRELRFVDPRRFGRLSVARGFAAAGKEPLEVLPDEFRRLFGRRKTPIKSALLNQKLLSGVGNIYADESLFRSAIRPRRSSGSLTHRQLERLRESVQEVLREAIALGGSSVSDYVDADGEEGFFQLQHRVYGREGEPCLVCKRPIRRVVIAGRSSHYCRFCQK